MARYGMVIDIDRCNGCYFQGIITLLSPRRSRIKENPGCV
jgi:Fe-S-cluster-containing dehydrogenase component